MAWYGTWAERIPLLAGTTIPGSTLTDFFLLVELLGNSDLQRASNRAGSDPHFATTLADGSTSTPHGTLYFSGNTSALASGGSFDSSTDTITMTGHGLQADDAVSWGANNPGGITLGGAYYLVNVTTNTFQVSATVGGSPVNLTTTGSFSAGDLALLVTDLIIRVKLTLASTAVTGDTIGYLYFDPAQTDEENKSGALDSNTVGYWPLEDSPTGSAGDIIDWTGSNDLTSSGGPSSASGKIANGISFDGVNDAAKLTTGSVLSTGLTCSLWINSPSASGSGSSQDEVCVHGDENFAIAWGSSNSSYDGAMFMRGNGSYPVAKWTSTLAANAWHHLAGTWDGSTLRVYVNGTQEASVANSTMPSLGGDWFTLTGFASRYFTGSLDEVRLCSVARSADWIAYEYANENVNSDTVTLGAKELISSGGSVFAPYFYRLLAGAGGCLGV